MGVNQSNVRILHYFRSIANMEADKETSRSKSQKIHSKLGMFYRNFEGTFKLRVKEGNHPYWPHP